MKAYKKEFYDDLYNKLSDMSLTDAEELAEKAETEDARFFFEMISNYLMQRKQIELIRKNVF
jgi:hypothetical protein